MWQAGASVKRTFNNLLSPVGRKPLFGGTSRTWSFLYWIPTIAVLGEYFYSLKVISGRSMQPTLNPDSSIWRDIGLFDKFSVHTLQQYSRGDIISLRSPENPKRVLVKRVIGLEGDLVKTLPPYRTLEIRVPKGHIWVEGDESFHSDDSNRFGPVPMALVESKLALILWPLPRFGPQSTRSWKCSRVIPKLSGNGDKS